MHCAAAWPPPRRRLPSRRPLVGAASIPPERLAQLRLHLRDHVALPEGVFYDGRGYISMDGDRTDEHPGWDDALAELLDELNAEVREANVAVDAALAEADAQAAVYLRSVGA